MSCRRLFSRVRPERPGGRTDSVNLPLQFAGGPTGVDGLGFVKGPRLGLLHPKKDPVVGPGQFSTHCVENWIRQIKGPYVPQVAAIETCSEFSTWALRKLSRKPPSVLGVLLPLLFLLDDGPPDLPVRGHAIHESLDALIQILDHCLHTPGIDRQQSVQVSRPQSLFPGKICEHESIRYQRRLVRARNSRGWAGFRQQNA